MFIVEVYPQSVRPRHGGYTSIGGQLGIQGTLRIVWEFSNLAH
jgi:hypothetical protein